MSEYIKCAIEVFRHKPVRAPEILAKLLIGRASVDMGPSLFFINDLHNRPLRSWRDYRKFDSPFQAMLREINWAADKNLSADKVRTAARCAERGVPDIPILGLIGRDTTAFPGGERFLVLNDLAAVEALLEDAGNPEELYVKPADGGRGQGQHILQRSVVGWLFDGRPTTTPEAAALLLESAPQSGFVVQPRLRSHRAMAPIGGSLGLSTVRIVVAHTIDGPQILVATLKIIGGQGHIDNFLGGTSGNLLAHIDLATGRLQHVVGRRPGQRYLMSPVDTHPVTKQLLPGFQLPCWPEVLAFAGQVSQAFPELLLPGLDVAVTDDGPLLVETNTIWNPAIQQLMTRRGIKTLLDPVLPRLSCSGELRAKAQALLAA